MWSSFHKFGKLGGASSKAVSAYLASVGLSGSNAGADFERAVYWLPSTADSSSAPRFASEAEFFAQFTRAGSATYLDSDGLIKTAAANVPRFDWSTGKRRLMLERASTNLAQHSSLIGASASWTAVNGPGAAGGLADPSGGTSATRLTYASVPNGYFQSRTLTAGQTTWSVYFRRVSGAASLQIGSDSNNGVSANRLASINTSTLAITNVNATGAVAAVGGGWYRFSVTVTLPATGNTSMLCYVTSAVGVVDVWQYQVEVGARATSPIATTSSAVTRAPDSCLLPAAGTSVTQRTAASVLVRGRLLSPGLSGSSRRIVGLADTSFLVGAVPTAENVARTFTNGASTLDATLGSGNFLTGFGVAIAFNSSGRSFCANGGVVTSDAIQVGDRSAVYLGRDGVYAGDPSDTLLSLFALVPSALSNSALQALTV